VEFATHGAPSFLLSVGSGISREDLCVTGKDPTLGLSAHQGQFTPVVGLAQSSLPTTLTFP
jgi:hypothetical protein